MWRNYNALVSLGGVARASRQRFGFFLKTILATIIAIDMIVYVITYYDDNKTNSRNSTNDT